MQVAVNSAQHFINIESTAERMAAVSGRRTRFAHLAFRKAKSLAPKEYGTGGSFRSKTLLPISAAHTFAINKNYAQLTLSMTNL